MSKTILITGGAGFIGSNFVKYLYQKYPDYKLIILDALTYAGSLQNLPVDVNRYEGDRLEFWYGNVGNAELVDSLMARAQMVVHFAAETHVTRSIYDNHLFFTTDILGTQTICNAIVRHQKSVERFVHISSSEVYGNAIEESMNEEHPLCPRSPYAAAKAGADRLVYSYWATYQIPSVIVRPFNNFGPAQHLEKLIPRFITSCILNEPLRLHGDGSAARDFVFVGDVCRGIDQILQAPLADVKGQVFNLATGIHRSNLSVAKDIVQLMGVSESNIHFVHDRPGQVERHTGDYSKAKKILHWNPQTTWMDGLSQTVDWYKKNRAYWEKQLWMRCVPIRTHSGTVEFH